MSRKNSNGLGTIRKRIVNGRAYYEARYTDPVTKKQRSISATTEHPDVARDFYKFVFSKHGGEVVARNFGGISTVKTAEVDYDPAVLNQFEFLENGNFCGYSEREWIPGIKEIMKQNVQDWMSGALTLEQALESWNNEHLRLLEADPGFKDEFEEYRAACKSLAE